MLFYAFKMTRAIVFLCKNAVEAIYAQNHRNRRNLNCFYSISAKKTFLNEKVGNRKN